MTNGIEGNEQTGLTHATQHHTHTRDGFCHACGAKLIGTAPESAPPSSYIEPRPFGPGPLRHTLLSKLSEAQQRVLAYLLVGLTEPQIAEKVGRSRHTVHDHTKAIYAALGVKRRVQLVLLFNGTNPRDLLPEAERGSLSNGESAARVA